MKRVFISVLTIGLVGGITWASTGAFFSDTEKSEGNSFTAGKVDLVVNEQEELETLINVDDLKPGDEYSVEKTLRVDDNDSFVWMMISDIQTSQGEQTDPEEEEEVLGGENSNLDEVLEYQAVLNGEDMVGDDLALSQVSGCWIPLGQMSGAEIHNMTQNFRLPSFVGNWAQGDQLGFSESFYAVQVRNNQNPQPPEAGEVWNLNSKKCEAFEQFVISDDSWKVTDSEVENWYLPEFDDSNWGTSVAPSYGTCDFSPINVFIDENGAQPMWIENPVEWGMGYFRKHFYLPTVSSGSIRAVLDDTGEIFINGNLVLTDAENTGNSLTSGDVTPYLKVGDNVVAMRVSDSAGTCQDVQFELIINELSLIFEDGFEGNLSTWDNPGYVFSIDNTFSRSGLASVSDGGYFTHTLVHDLGEVKSNITFEAWMFDGGLNHQETLIGVSETNPNIQGNTQSLLSVGIDTGFSQNNIAYHLGWNDQVSSLPRVSGWRKYKIVTNGIENSLYVDNQLVTTTTFQPNWRYIVLFANGSDSVGPRSPGYWDDVKVY